MGTWLTLWRKWKIRLARLLIQILSSASLIASESKNFIKMYIWNKYNFNF